MASVTMNTAATTPPPSQFALSPSSPPPLTANPSPPPWSPNSDTLASVHALLRHSTAPDSSIQANLFRSLQRLSSLADFVNYLAYIVAAPTTPDDAARQSAGLVLKSHIPLSYRSLAPAVRAYVPAALVHAMSHRAPAVRMVVSSCISTLAATALDLSACDPLLSVVVQTLSPFASLSSSSSLTTNPSLDALDALDACLCVLARLAEDVPKLLDTHTSRPLHIIIPACISLLRHVETARPLTLTILNHLVLSMPNELASHVDDLVRALLHVASDDTACVAQVRKRICTAFCILLEVAPAALNSHVGPIIEFMLKSTAVDDRVVAREAAEFWSLFAHAAVNPLLIRPALPRLVRLLLQNMMYTPEEVDMFNESLRQQQQQYRQQLGNNNNYFNSDSIADIGNNSNHPYGDINIDDDDDMCMSTSMKDDDDFRSGEEMRPRFHQPKFKDTSGTGIGSSDMNGQASLMTMNMNSSMNVTMAFDNPSSTPNSSATNNTTTRNLSNVNRNHLHNENDTIDEDIPLSNDNADVIVRDHDLHNADNDNVNDADADADDDDDEFMLDDESEWTLRKSCAAALDVLSCVLKTHMLDELLPVVQSKLGGGGGSVVTGSGQATSSSVTAPGTESWAVRECSVLALGAVAEGCFDSMKTHMRSIFPFLLHVASSDEHPMVRAISCWTLSRYCKWVILERDDMLFAQLLKVLLDGMVHHDRTVQKACCSALAVFEEESGSLLVSYITPMLNAFATAFELYSPSARYVLYDVVCTLADAVGTELAAHPHVSHVHSTLMPILLKCWNQLKDNDPHMLPLLECLASVVRALGSRCQPFAGTAFARCCSIISGIYMRENPLDHVIQREDIVGRSGNQQQQSGGSSSHPNGNDFGEPIRDYNHVDFVTCALDLCCAVTEALGPAVETFMSSSSSSSSSSSPISSSASKLHNLNNNHKSDLIGMNGATGATTTSNATPTPGLSSSVVATSSTAGTVTTPMGAVSSLGGNSIGNNVHSNGGINGLNGSHSVTGGTGLHSPKSSKVMLTLLFVCMKDERHDIRQSAFALLGELARARLPSMVGNLCEYTRCAVQGLNPQYSSVANNATWALGELAIMATILPSSKTSGSTTGANTKSSTSSTTNMANNNNSTDNNNKNNNHSSSISASTTGTANNASPSARNNRTGMSIPSGAQTNNVVNLATTPTSLSSTSLQFSPLSLSSTSILLSSSTSPNAATTTPPTTATTTTIPIPTAITSSITNTGPTKEDVEKILLDERCVNVIIDTVNRGDTAMNKSLLENCALTLGRIGAVFPASLAPKLHLFAQPSLSALRNIRDDVEKEQAFHGFNAMIRHNPTAIYQCFPYYVDAVASWFHSKPDLEIEFACIFNAYKSTLQDQWFLLFNSLSVPSQNLLKERFGV